MGCSWEGRHHCATWSLLYPPEPAVNLEQCQQLVAELQGSMRQAVRLYHSVSVGRKKAL